MCFGGHGRAVGPLADQGIGWIGLAGKGDHAGTLWNHRRPKVTRDITRQTMRAIMLNPRFWPESNPASNRLCDVMLLKPKALGNPLGIFLKVF